MLRAHVGEGIEVVLVSASSVVPAAWQQVEVCTCWSQAECCGSEFRQCWFGTKAAFACTAVFAFSVNAA